MLKKILNPTTTKRLIFFILLDSFIFVISLYISFLLRFDFYIPSVFMDSFFYSLPIFIFVKVFLFYLNKLYFISWRFISVVDFFKIVISLLLAIFIIGLFNYLYYYVVKIYLVPRSIPLIDFFISLTAVSIFRVSKRVYIEIIKNKKTSAIKKTIIIGAGDSGEKIARELIKKDLNMLPVAFLDDNIAKQNIYIHNIPVIGKIDDLDNAIKSTNIETIIIAIPSLSYKKIKQIFETAKQNQIKDVKIVPNTSFLLKDSISIKDLRDINLEDLLARKPVKIDASLVREFIKGKIVFITGAAGSIGSEILRQIINFSPKKVIAFEIDETELHNLSLEISHLLIQIGKKIDFDYIVGDIRDFNKLDEIFKKYDIDIVFHAAAYKHVPLMEHYPEEAVKTNIFGTYNLVVLSKKHKIKKFINISTDKAVNPTSIMGATKRIAEIICSAFNDVTTKYISVRFGNVLGSRGSVIPIFLEQIKHGGPVTVTHPEMKRYFMTIPEAVLLVFQSAAMGSGGEVFVLDMGEPVKIVSLAKDLIKLQGLEPNIDIKIEFTGLRPGEKLFEELLTAEEGTEATKHQSIFTAKISNGYSIEKVQSILEDLKTYIYKSPENIKKYLQKVVPFYRDDKIS